MKIEMDGVLKEKVEIENLHRNCNKIYFKEKINGF